MFDGVSWVHGGGSTLRMVLINGLGQWDKVQMSHTVLKEMKINIHVLGVARWGRSPPRVKDPNFIEVRHDHWR